MVNLIEPKLIVLKNAKFNENTKRKYDAFKSSTKNLKFVSGSTYNQTIIMNY